MTLNAGEIIDGKYRIIRLVGEGGMGSVYEGENYRIRRRVAIKVLHAASASDRDTVQRFEREAQAAGRIGSEHIVEVLDLGQLPGGDRYMVMEFLEGESLSQRIIGRGKIPPLQTALLMTQLLEGLKAAHGAGITHRDLKPDNVFLLPDKRGRIDFVKILDFGISKFSTLGGEFSMTRTGTVMGTPHYLSPEQAKGERQVDHRSDIYAVGVIMWEASAGRVPFDAETFNELLFKIVLNPLPALSTATEDIDPIFSEIVQRAMAREPEGRFQTADEMQAALMVWVSNQMDPDFPGRRSTLINGSKETELPGQSDTKTPPSPSDARDERTSAPASAGWSKAKTIGSVTAVLLSAAIGYLWVNQGSHPAPETRFESSVPAQVVQVGSVKRELPAGAEKATSDTKIKLGGENEPLGKAGRETLSVEQTGPKRSAAQKEPPESPAPSRSTGPRAAEPTEAAAAPLPEAPQLSGTAPPKGRKIRTVLE